MSEHDTEVARLEQLTVAVLADVLDRLGLRSQVLDHSVRPLLPEERLAGRAFPIQSVRSGEILENPYEHEIAAVDAVPSGAVLVIAAAGALDVGIWGELLTTRALARGAVGAVTDGAVRDLAGLRRLRFPTFAAAVSANDSAGRLAVTQWGRPIVCAGVAVRPGDLVLGDPDGVVVVPAEAAGEALAAAEAKRSKEDAAREALEAGASVSEVYERHGIL